MLIASDVFYKIFYGCLAMWAFYVCGHWVYYGDWAETLDREKNFGSELLSVDLGLCLADLLIGILVGEINVIIFTEFWSDIIVRIARILSYFDIIFLTDL